jgi:hypothetical protein
MAHERTIETYLEKLRILLDQNLFIFISVKTWTDVVILKYFSPKI